MQVKSLFIKDFQQFKDFELDLTYPAGHELAGQALKKVCIIGQSGTGKTTLLRFLKEMTTIKTYFDYESLGGGSVVACRNKKYEDSKITLFIPTLEIHLNITIRQNKKLSNYYDDEIKTYEGEKVGYSSGNDNTSTTSKIYPYLNINEKISNLFIPADILYKISEIDEKEEIKEKANRNDDGPANNETHFIDLSEIHFSRFKTVFLKYKIDEFKETLIQKRNEFAKLATNPNTTAKQLTEEAQKLREWEEQQENPLKKLGEEFLDRILNHFNLRVKTEVDFQDIGFIKLETLQGEPVESDIWSTGTKQVILTALPFYALKPENAIILFDEPERSLYPDIQTKIIDFYTSLAPSSQFFFATHSPLIASCFEPWEIVELKFNEAGKVYREQYYEGENHVDNYKFYPEYLRYDTILSKIFDLPNDANKKRQQILNDLAVLETQLKNGVSKEDKQKLWVEYQAKQKKVSWEGDDEKY